MNTKRKHWSELGRVKSSAWFRNLPELERACVLAALEHDTHESAVKLRAMLAFVYLTIIYAIAFAIWGLVFQSSPLWFGIGGAILGAVVGLLSANTIASQKTPRDAKAMQAIAAVYPGGFGIVLAAAGLVGWLIRVLFFR